MPKCRLCGEEKLLRNSHIIPEFLYANLYNEKGHMMGINGKGNKGWRPLQQGLREHLFCETCEQHFNESCEKPFRAQWIVDNPLPSPWHVAEPHIVTVDYASFKLFHLSVLFRAGICTLPTFSETKLGPHEDRLRDMLLRRDPGPYWQYAVFGLVVLHNRTRAVLPIISQSQECRIEGQRCFAAIYGGAQWWVGVSSHRNAVVESISLRPDGQLPLWSINWNDLGVMKAASTLLRRASQG